MAVDPNNPRTWMPESSWSGGIDWRSLTGGDWMWGDPKVELDPNKAKLADAGYMRDVAKGGIAGAQGRAAPQMGPLNEMGQGQWRQQQLALANRLSGIATGQQQGAGELAVQRQGARAAAGQQAMASMARGGSNAAAAARGAARNIGDIGIGVAGQAQQAALGDQMAANQTLSQVMQGARGQDISMAGLQQQGQLANLDAQLRQTGMNDAAIVNYLAAMYGISNAEMQARLAQDQMAIGQRSPGMAGTLIGAGAQIGAMAASDERVKTDVNPGEETLASLFRGLGVHDYRYKDGEGLPTGRRLSPMAQEIEKSPLGAALVSEDEQGRKFVDYGKGLGTMMAGLALHQKKLDELEKKKG